MAKPDAPPGNPDKPDKPGKPPTEPPVTEPPVTEPQVFELLAEPGVFVVHGTTMTPEEGPV